MDTRMMTPKEFEEAMVKAFKGSDIEASHSKADDLMCDLLTALGYGDGIKVFNENDKWYA